MVTPRADPCRPVLEPTQTRCSRHQHHRTPELMAGLSGKTTHLPAYVELGGVTVSAESRAATCKDEGVGKGAPVGRAPFAL